MKKPLECLKQVKELLASLPNSENQATWLCCHMLDIDTVHLLLNDLDINDQDYNALMQMAKRVSEGYPLQYATESTQFMGLNFSVSENVLIPRNDTEVLVDLAIKHIGRQKMRILDLCCGSGCIGLSVKYYCPSAAITFGDISDDALLLTKRNADSLGINGDIIKTDMFSEIKGTFDVILSNPPYIPTNVLSTLSPQVHWEPTLALDGKDDGLYYYRIIKNEYRRFLNPGGIMLLEMGYDQGKQLQQLFGSGEVIPDYQSRDRIIRLVKENV